VRRACDAGGKGASTMEITVERTTPVAVRGGAASASHARPEATTSGQRRGRARGRGVGVTREAGDEDDRTAPVASRTRAEFVTACL
jgi:hypothetical protein